jgi:Luciferase-like monooxygenase
MEFHLFLPQLRLSFDRLVASARAAEAAVSLDHASGGRFELGLGWGSWEGEFSMFGVGPAGPAARVQPVIGPLAARDAPGTAAGREEACR